MMNSDHNIEAEPLMHDNKLHHRENVAITINRADSNGSSSNGSPPSPPHNTPSHTRSTRRRIKKKSFWDRTSGSLRISNNNYAKYGKKRVRRNAKLQHFMFWGTIGFVSFVLGFTWRHFSNSSNNYHQIHTQLRHAAEGDGEGVPSNPYAKLHEQQHDNKQQNDNNYKNKNKKPTIQILIPRFDTKRYMNSYENKLKNAANQISKKHPKSIMLEGWNSPIAFRNFPYAKQTHGPIKNIDSDYGGLTYHSIRNEEVFARIIPDEKKGDEDTRVFSAFEPDDIGTTRLKALKELRLKKRTRGSYPKFESDGTKVLQNDRNVEHLKQYYDDDSVNILQKSNTGDRNAPRACKKPEFAQGYYPTCNAFHEHDLGRVYDDPNKMLHPRPENEIYRKYLAHGYYRDVWVMEDNPWIWPDRYPKEKESIPTKKYGVEDEERTSEMITKAYRSTALKTFQMKHPFSDEHWGEVQLEAIIMERMTKSPRIMNMYGHCGFSTMVEVVPIELEEVVVPGEGYEEHDVVEERNKDGLRPYNNFTPEEKLGFALEMAESLADLHGFEEGIIVHDDVQLCQWLRTSEDDRKLKLGDFNRATIMQWDMVQGGYCKFNNGPAFANYRAPEEFAARNLNEQIDTWSFGNNVYALLTGLWNFYAMTDDEVVQKKLIDGENAFIDPRYKERSFIERKLVELVEKCWIYDPAERISIFEAVDYLKEVIKENELQKSNNV